MKVMIVYDSVYGNTEQIAKAVASAFQDQDELTLLPASEATPDQVAEAGLVIFGAPTQGGKPTKGIQEFINRIPDTTVKGTNVAVFDTRITSKLAGIFGYAAGKMAGSLKARGGNVISEPEGFFVKGSKGPLKDGELERAASWAKGIAEAQRARMAYTK